MDLSRLLKAPIVELVGGTSVSFPRITARDMASVAARIKGERRQARRESEEGLALKPVEAYRLRSEEYDVSTFGLIDYFQTPQGAMDGIRISLGKASIAPAHIDAVIDAMTIAEMSNLVLRLTGLNVIWDELQGKTTAKPAEKPQPPVAANGEPPSLGNPAIGGAPPLPPAVLGGT